jgi:hypothetical protein
MAFERRWHAICSLPANTLPWRSRLAGDGVRLNAARLNGLIAGKPGFYQGRSSNWQGNFDE